LKPTTRFEKASQKGSVTRRGWVAVALAARRPRGGAPGLGREPRPLLPVGPTPHHREAAPTRARTRRPAPSRPRDEDRGAGPMDQRLLLAEGRPVDWLYRGAGKVATTIERGVSGQTACHYRPDRPTAFTSTSTSGRSTAAARSTTPRACYGNSSRRPRSTRPSSSARSSRSTHGRPESPSRSPASRQQGASLPRLGCLFRGVLHSAGPLRCQ
jgi:hypothetical protein